VSTPPGRRLVVDAAALHTVLAVLVGVGWWLWAPQLTYTVVDGQPLVVREVGYTAIFSGDATFAVLAGGAGLLSATVLLLRGHRGPAVPVVLTALGTAAAFGAWWIGVTLGPGRIDELAAAAGQGDLVAGPELNAYAAVLVWPLVAVSAVFVATAFSGPERRRPRRLPSSAE
jgi:hypothetical protein